MLYTVKNSLYSRRKKSALNIVLNALICILACVFLFELYFVQTYKGIYVLGDSMLPTITGADSSNHAGGDYVFVNKRTDPDYFDIVVVDVTSSLINSSEEKYIIKRAVAFGGDTVYMEQGQLYLKKKGEKEFTAISEDYIHAENITPEAAKNSFAEHTVADGCMFLLGDNRDYSSDSRANGDYSLSDLIGVVPWWSMKFKSQITAIYTFLSYNI